MHFAQKYLERRFRNLKVYPGRFVYVGLDVPQATDFSAQLTQGKFTDAPNAISTTAELRARRQRPPSTEGIWLRQPKLGELLRLATASRPGICAVLARPGAKAGISQERDIY